MNYFSPFSPFPHPPITTPFLNNNEIYIEIVSHV
jgi:hypothetical protein